MRSLLRRVFARVRFERAYAQARDRFQQLING